MASDTYHAAPPPRFTPQTSRPRKTAVEPDPDYLADLEQADAQKWKRRSAAHRGKRVKPPQPRHG